MKHHHIYMDESGESHFNDIDVQFEKVMFAPPAPPVDLSPYTPAARFAFCSFPAGWTGDWHPSPRRQIFFILSGEISVKVSDGEVRTFVPGDAILGEDTDGKGHYTWVNGDSDVNTVVVQLP